MSIWLEWSYWGPPDNTSAVKAPAVPTWPASETTRPWTCPKCGSVWAPFVPGCFKCNSEKK